jgi:2-polyprenyl-3-methyl-5-hydroxy-6-metoxy-1,4-benzoquinol methylase
MKKIIEKIAASFGYRLCTCDYIDSIISERDRLLASSENLRKEVDYYKKQDATKYLPAVCKSYFLEDVFKKVQFSHAGLQKLIKDYEFETVLDVGAGAMNHSEIFAMHGKKVTAVDYGVSVYYKQHVTKEGIVINKIFGDFNTLKLDDVYDCVWASHILEHQTNAEGFLKKLVSLVKEGGVIAITVPPLKHEIVGGHVSLWNAGLVLYRLVLTGVDCSDAAILAYGYNITVIVRKRTIDTSALGIEFDCGDIRRIKQYLPTDLEFNSNELDDQFNGNIYKLNW